MECKINKQPTLHSLSRASRSWSLCVLSIFAIISFIASSCDDSEDAKRTDTSKELVIKDAAYGPDVNNTLDLFLPAGRTSQTPIVVFIHGGGWREGSKEQYAGIIGDFVAQGFAAASINYRPANVDAHISYIELLADIDKSLEYLQANASQNVYNAKDVTLFGHSAGAHLALLYAYRNNTRGQVQSVISLSAPTDLEDLLEKNVFPGLLYNLVGSEDIAKYQDASPITHAKPGSVPTFFIHGKADESVPYQQSQMLFDQLAQWNKMANRLELVDNAGHDFSLELQEAIVAESIIYLKEGN